MQTFGSAMAAREAILDFRADHFSEVPELYRPRLKAQMIAVGVDQIVGTGEFIYANREAMPDPAKALAAGLIAFATLESWHGLAEDDRGSRIVANLRKELGEIKTAPAAPEPRPQFIVTPPVVPIIDNATTSDE